MIVRSVTRIPSLTGSGEQFTAAEVKFSNTAEEAVFLRRMVDQWRKRPDIRELAIKIVFDEYGCPDRAKLCQALSIGDWTQRTIHYVNEGFETFQTPSRTLKLGAGDCDDFVTLECSLLEAIGIRSEIVAMKINGHWSHIFARAVVPHPIRRGAWLTVPLDATLTRPVGNADPIALSLARGDQVKTIVV